MASSIGGVQTSFAVYGGGFGLHRPGSTGRSAESPDIPQEPNGVSSATETEQNRAGGHDFSGVSAPTDVSLAASLAQVAPPVSAQSLPEDERMSKTAAAKGGGAEASETDAEDAENGQSVDEKGANGQPLDTSEKMHLQHLRQADNAVRAHERAHLAAAGGLATGGALFSYERGPDGQNYAVAGEVGIDTGSEATPEATIAKMRKVRAAALAPANPSPQDRRVASQAAMTMVESQAELQQISRKDAEAQRLEAAGGEEKETGGEVGARAIAGYGAATGTTGAVQEAGRSGVNITV